MILLLIGNKRKNHNEQTGLYTYHPTTPPTQNATTDRGSKEDHAKTGLYAKGFAQMLANDKGRFTTRTVDLLL